MYKILLLKGERNDATDFYVNIIKKSIEKKGNKVSVVDKIKLIDKNDRVLVITAKAFFFVWLRNPKQYIFTWFQGIVPEEAMMIFKNSKLKYIRKFYNQIWEKIALKYSKFNFFVSKAMQQHYEKKYGYKKNNYFLMPCFNQKLNEKAFRDEKYSVPTFLYAGTLSDWQCINKTLQIFKKIQNKKQEAKLFLYTPEIEKAKQMAEKYQIENVFVDYVHYSELNEKIADIKYGFLIRENVNVNQVATPTKMNSYLANGIIPIYSDVICDFKDNLQGKYLISATEEDDFVEKVIELEQQKLSSELIYNEYKGFFEKYYSEDYYIKHIGQKIDEKF